MKTSSSKTLFLPTIKAFMGDWNYYIVSMKIKEIASRISVASDFYESKTLSDLLQRALDESKHVKQISKYLLTDKQRFFNAIVVGIYGGAPRWHELSVPRHTRVEKKLLPDYLEGAFGVLELTGAEQIFAIDGQHRVYGMKEAQRTKGDLGIEEVTVIFVPHKLDKPGKERTRRLFTRLNRFAKPVRPEEIISLDEDDISAITTRAIVEDWVPLQNKISIKNTKSLSPSDKNHFTTISVLYEICDILLKPLNCKKAEWQERKRNRPSDTELKNSKETVVSYLKALGAAFIAVQYAYDSDSKSEFAVEHRGRHGGHVAYRPIGLLIYTRAYRRLLDNGWSTASALASLAQVSQILSDAPWKGVIWNEQSGKMLYNVENQKVAEEYLIYSAIDKPEKLGVTRISLIRQLAQLWDVSESDVRL